MINGAYKKVSKNTSPKKQGLSILPSERMDKKNQINCQIIEISILTGASRELKQQQ